LKDMVARIDRLLLSA